MNETNDTTVITSTIRDIMSTTNPFMNKTNVYVVITSNAVSNPSMNKTNDTTVTTSTAVSDL